MRIGTWNLDGHWTPRHREVLLLLDCDLWLLTEVAAGTRLPGCAAVMSETDMLPGKAWAAVLSRRPLEALPDPHPASAAARVGDLVVCASVLPWRSSGGEQPWRGTDQGGRTVAAVDDLAANLPGGALVWGGDLNHALEGSEVAGSAVGADRIRRFMEDRGLTAPTVGRPHQLPGVKTIDHVAVPVGPATEVFRHPADGLSDHDVYVVEVADR